MSRLLLLVLACTALHTVFARLLAEKGLEYREPCTTISIGDKNEENLEILELMPVEVQPGSRTIPVINFLNISLAAEEITVCTDIGPPPTLIANQDYSTVEVVPLPWDGGKQTFYMRTVQYYRGIDPKVRERLL